MPNRFFLRRQMWWPAWPGWIGLLVIVISPVLGWWFAGEEFLARTDRRKADVLVVEGWIGLEGMRAAKAEFEQGGYRLLVTVGASTNNRWERHQSNYAELAREELIRLGLAPAEVLAAPSEETSRQRTFASAVAAFRVMRSQPAQAQAINIFTIGTHARRSRLVFAKVMPPEIEVGAIAWRPAAYGSNAWWKSSEQAAEMIKETVGYFFEALLNSGRLSNQPPDLKP